MTIDISMKETLIRPKRNLTFKAIFIDKRIGITIKQKFTNLSLKKTINNDIHKMKHQLIKECHGLSYEPKSGLTFYSDLLDGQRRDPVNVEIGDYIIFDKYGYRMLISQQQYHDHFEILKHSEKQLDF